MKMISRGLSKYIAILLINVQNNFAYAGEFFYRSFFMILIIFIFMHLWKAAYGASGSTSISGITLNNLIWYLVMTEAILMSRPVFSGKISDEVKDGTLAYTIGRPFNYLLFHYASGMGDTILRIIINFASGSLLAFLLVGPCSFNPVFIPFLVITIAMGLLLDFLIEGLIGLSAFLIEDVSGIQLVYSKLLFILGGLMIPLDFFPLWLQGIAKCLPFHLILYAPARLFIDFSLESWLGILGLQFIWIIVLGSSLVLFFSAAMRRLSINGG